MMTMMVMTLTIEGIGDGHAMTLKENLKDCVEADVDEDDFDDKQVIGGVTF